MERLTQKYTQIKEELQTHSLNIQQLNLNYNNLSHEIEKKIKDQYYEAEKQIYSKFKKLYEQFDKIFSSQKIRKIDQRLSHTETQINQYRNSLKQNKEGFILQPQDNITNYRPNNQYESFEQIQQFMNNGQDNNNNNTINQNQKHFGMQSLTDLKNLFMKKRIKRNHLKQCIYINRLSKKQEVKNVCCIKIVKLKRLIAIGLIDQNYKSMDKKSFGNGWIYYRNDKQIWDGTSNYYNQGFGFKVGQTIKLQYDIESSKQFKIQIKVDNIGQQDQLGSIRISL